MSGALDGLAAELGIVRQYRDGNGREVAAPDESIRALAAAMDAPAETEAEAAASLAERRAARAAGRLAPWAVVAADAPAAIRLGDGDAPDWRLELEDGQSREGRAAAGAITLGPLPAGYHRLCAGGQEMTLLAAPPRLPDVPRGWGVMAPLYGLRPEGQGGIGDYRELALAAGALGAGGADFIGINPVHAGFPGDHLNYSPYAPSHRERFAVQHVAVPGAIDEPGGVLIDYEKCLPVKLAALDAAFRAFEAGGGDPAFDAWCAEEGDALTRFCTHQALAERHGSYWPDWPAAYRSPEGAAVAAFAAAHPDRLRAHAWRQWMAERQLEAAQRAARAAGMRHGLYLDLAVGAHPAGAETWGERDLFARGVSQGAPPDGFSPEGQIWNLAPMRPDTLVARGFAPMARILRRQLRFAGILRIDHILGFERSFWVPLAGGLPGAYVTMPRAALLAVARIEAARAGAVIVGEDLGAVPEGLRAELARAGILGCSVAMFERDWEGDGSFFDPGRYPALSVASFGSHDLPLWRGWRAGRDIDWRERLGALTAAAAEEARAGRAREVAAFDRIAGAAGADATGMVRFLAQSAARLAALQIEDLLEAEEQPNLPGTIHAHPNWRRRLRVAPQALGDVTLVKQAAAIMARHGR